MLGNRAVEIQLGPWSDLLRQALMGLGVHPPNEKNVPFKTDCSKKLLQTIRVTAIQERCIYESRTSFHASNALFTPVRCSRWRR